MLRIGKYFLAEIKTVKISLHLCACVLRACAVACELVSVDAYIYALVHVCSSVCVFLRVYLRALHRNTHTNRYVILTKPCKI